MANIKDLKKKIKSTKGTLKITTAMKLVSAAKLAKAQEAIVNSRPYAKELENFIKTISALVQNYKHPYLKSNRSSHAIVLVIASDRGLCAGYNSQLAKAIRCYTERNSDNMNYKFVFIGKKVRDIIKNDLNIGKTYMFEKLQPDYLEIKEIAEELAALFVKGEFGKVFVAYNEFKSAIAFNPTIKQLLPTELEPAEADELKKQFPFDFKYEPSVEKILDDLIPEAYVNTIYTCLLDAVAAEHGSRMSAMDSASNNCKDAVKTLSLKMNKLRQAAITTELIEVVSGAESLNG